MHDFGCPNSLAITPKHVTCLLVTYILCFPFATEAAEAIQRSIRHRSAPSGRCSGLASKSVSQIADQFPPPIHFRMLFADNQKLTSAPEMTRSSGAPIQTTCAQLSSEDAALSVVITATSRVAFAVIRVAFNDTLDISAAIKSLVPVTRMLRHVVAYVRCGYYVHRRYING